MSKPGRMLGEVLAHLGAKPATIRYPFEPAHVQQGLRGKIKFMAEKCIGCRICMKDCPADAIIINKIGDKRFECVFDLAKCIYCAQCVDSCPKKALAVTIEFELAQLDKSKLRFVFHAPDAPPAPATPATTAAQPDKPAEKVA